MLLTSCITASMRSATAKPRQVPGLEGERSRNVLDD